MNNPGYEMRKVFEEIDRYQDRIVAFVDVMGIRNKMKEAQNPQDLSLFSEIMYINGNQPFAENKIETIMFSDCMYLVTESKYIDQIISLLANFAYNLLVNRIVHVKISQDGKLYDNVDWKCFKLRGGITFGKVLVLDEEARKKNKIINSNIIIGPAVITAYELENNHAIYPRIITDEAFNSLLKRNKISFERCSLVRDKDDGFYYLDFWNYMFKGKHGPNGFLPGCIEYIKNELEEALKSGNAKLVGQLLWYIRYLEKHE